MIRKISEDTITYTRDNDGSQIAQVQEELAPDACLVRMAGDIGNEIADEVSDELAALLSVGRAPRVDMEGVTYLSSTMIDRLIALQRRMETRMQATLPIRNVPKPLFEALERDGFVYSLDIEMKEE